MDDTAIAFALSTMVIGAILGSVLAPIGDAKLRKILRKKERAIGFGSALLSLLVANAIWIIAEVMLRSLINIKLPTLKDDSG